MNLRFLNTVVAISRHSTLVAAAESIGLSHSAVSVQVRMLEEELNIQILDRSRRPPMLTDEGHALVEHAKRMQVIADDIRSLAGGAQLHGNVVIGSVPSAITHLVAPALAAFSNAHPALQIELHTGLSNHLIQRVMERDIDSAIVTAPGEESQELSFETICLEPFELIASTNEANVGLDVLLGSRPFVWFDRRSWLSRQVESFLLARNTHVHSLMEVDSIEAVEALVTHGLGVSILPRRVGSIASEKVRVVSLGSPPLQRRVSLVTRRNSPRQQIASKLATTLRSIVSPVGAGPGRLA